MSLPMFLKFPTKLNSILGYLKSELVKRFESHFVKGQKKSCWEWTGGRSSSGHGKFSLWGVKEARASRVSWLIYVGDIPDGYGVLHRCGNAPCVNPSHLYLGTAKDNTDDRGRDQQARGKFKLAPDQIEFIRADRRSYRIIAKDFGIDSARVSRIKGRKSYKHV